jgi:hypothetical protein
MAVPSRDRDGQLVWVVTARDDAGTDRAGLIAEPPDSASSRREIAACKVNKQRARSGQAKSRENHEAAFTAGHDSRRHFPKIRS